MTRLNSSVQAILDNHTSYRTQVFMDGDDYCFNHDGSYYKVISANDRNLKKLEVIRTHNLPLTVKLETYDVDTFQFSVCVFCAAVRQEIRISQRQCCGVYGFTV